MKKNNKIFSTIILLALVVALGFAAPTTWAQEEEDPEGSSVSGDEEAAAQARLARRLRTSSFAELSVGDDKIVLSTGVAPADGPDYATIADLKDGEVLLLTRCQSIKLRTPVNLKIGGVDLKTDNVAENYPGVYSIWLKKVGSGWSMIFNEKPDVWGTMYDNQEDVGEVPVTYSKLDTPAERLSFELAQENNSGTLSLKWGSHQWSTKFTIVN